MADLPLNALTLRWRQRPLLRDSSLRNVELNSGVSPELSSCEAHMFSEILFPNFLYPSEIPSGIQLLDI